MVPPRRYKKTARMSSGGNAPRRVLWCRRTALAEARERRHADTALPRRSTRIARRSGLIDAVTESAIIHLAPKAWPMSRVRVKITARRSDGSRVNRVQLATRAAARGHALNADVQSLSATVAAIDAKKFAEDAMKAANEAAHIHAHAEAQRLADIAAAEQSMRADVEAARATSLLDARLRFEAEHRAHARAQYRAFRIARRRNLAKLRAEAHAEDRAEAPEALEAPEGPDPDSTDYEDGVFSDYEPSIPNYSPSSHVYSVDDVEADLTPAEESDDDIQCGQPLSPIILHD